MVFVSLACYLKLLIRPLNFLTGNFHHLVKFLTIQSCHRNLALDTESTVLLAQQAWVTVFHKPGHQHDDNFHVRRQFHQQFASILLKLLSADQLFPLFLLVKAGC